MIRGTNPKTGRVEALNNKQIKAEILELTGWTSTEYEKQYSIYRNKLRNYETITGAATKTPINEMLLSSIRRKAFDQPLTALQAGIESTTSASTASVARAVKSNNLSARQTDLAFKAIEANYKGLMEKAHYDELWIGRTVKEVYEEWKNEVVGVDFLRDSKGYVIYDEITGYPTKVEILRSSKISPADVEKFFRDTANALHQRQAREYSTNEAKYGKNRRSVGS